VDIPLPWERLLWRARPRSASSVASGTSSRTSGSFAKSGNGVDELVLHDIGDVVRTESGLDPIFGTSTLVVRPHDARRAPLVLRRVRQGPHLAALLELLAGEPATELDAAGLSAAIAWNPHTRLRGFR